MAELLQVYEPGQTPMPHEDATAIGIDLGTTHSVVAVSSSGQAEAIHDAHGRAIIPSVVQLRGDDVLVGHEARRGITEGEKDIISSAKRLMGKSAADMQGLRLPFTIDTQKEGLVRIQAGGKSVTPVEVSAEILKHLRQMAEEALGREVRQAVITVPAYFDDAARTATKDAAKLAGLTVLRLINEPTAAALAYGLESQAQGIFAIYDFGGGTFDISVLKLEEGVFQVLSTAGDTQLGGDDIDAAIAVYALEHLDRKELPPEEMGQLLAACRAAKESLSEKADTEIYFDGAHIPLTRPQMIAMAEPFVARSLQACDAALRDAQLTPQAMAGVVLVGGSTRMPYIKAEVEKFFGIAPHDKLDPDLVVALGAALQAEALTKGSENLLLDVTPLSLGLETMGGITEKVIYRNTPIPVAAAQEFTTYQDGQTAMKIHVLQGEREKVADCRSLAQFTLKGIPPMAAGVARIRVSFAIDADGVLTVAAKELTSGEEQQIEVKPSYGLEFEEIERMLRDSMEHARTDIAERLLIEVRVEADRLAADVKKAIAAEAGLLKEGEGAMIEAQMKRLAQAAQGVDRERVDHEMQRLNELAGPFAQRRMDKAIAGALAGQNVDEVK